MREPTMPNAYPGGDWPEPPVPPADLLDDLARAGLDYDVATETRAEHARDWWPRTIALVARRAVEAWPGVVVRAHSTGDVATTMRVASARRVAVTVQGGRSGVVGGASPREGAIALDVTGLNRVIDLDERSQLVRVEAGVFGPELETWLGARGFTLGHFPQSFELATVGGWLACRGAGQYSNRYGKIEDVVRALSVVLANGEVIDVGGQGPRRAVGPDLTQLFVGSEGTLGIITEATFVVRRRASAERRAAYLFPTFSSGMRVCRELLQRDTAPAVLRLYDEGESARHFNVDGCALIVLDEGEAEVIDVTMRRVADGCGEARELSVDLVAHWLATRNDVGALAPLWERGLVVDTIEVAGRWSVLDDLHARVVAALLREPGMLVATVHQSHAYVDGACLYFTFAGTPDGDADAFYRRAWDVAMAEVLLAGASISHHHGVGHNRARFVADALGTGFSTLVALKHELDPHGLLNPGVLGLGGPPW